MADILNPKKLSYLKFWGEDFFLPPREDDILLHFKEIILVRSSYVTFFSFLLLAVYEYSVGLIISPLVGLLLAVINFFLLMYLRLKGKFGLIASMHIFLVWMKVTFILLETGGIDSNMLLWYVLVITLAFEYIDDRFGLSIWILIVFVSVGAIAYMTKLGFLLGQNKWELHYEIFYNLLFIIIYTAILFIYISERNIYQKELLSKTANLEVANEEYSTMVEELYMQNQAIRDLNDRLEDKQRLISHQMEVLRSLMKARTEAIAYINKQKYIIQGYLNELEESVKYAQALQMFFLTDIRIVNDYLYRYFIINQQKYIVGGDFYFVHPIDNDRVLILLGDATGHSSPGAILGTLAIILLKRLVQQGIFYPNDILDRLRQEITDLFSGITYQDVFYGIEAVAILYDKSNKTIYSATAGHSFIIMDNKTIREIKSKNTLIASYTPDQKTELLKFDVKSGDRLLLYTDGYYSQLNTEYNKYSKKRFKSLLQRISGQPLFVQKEILEFEYKEWKKNMEQTDDITIIALQF